MANAELAAAHALAVETGDDGDLREAIARYTTTKPIEEIAEGEIVLSRPDDDAGAAPVFSVVEQTYVREAESIVTIEAVRERDGEYERLKITPFHPVWVDDTGGERRRLADVERRGLHVSAHYATTADGQVMRGVQGWFHARDLRQGYVLRGAGSCAARLRGWSARRVTLEGLESRV